VLHGNPASNHVRDPWAKAQKRGSNDVLLGRSNRYGAKVARIHEPGLNPLAGGATYYSIYGPTIFAVNESMPDPMASRCVQIVPPQAGGRWPDLTPEHGLPYRERLVALAARIYADNLPHVPKPLDGRLGDILHSLAHIACLIGDDAYQSFLKSAHQGLANVKNRRMILGRLRNLAIPQLRVICTAQHAATITLRLVSTVLPVVHP
jgi:hypothetical protein